MIFPSCFFYFLFTRIIFSFLHLRLFGVEAFARALGLILVLDKVSRCRMVESSSHCVRILFF